MVVQVAPVNKNVSPLSKILVTSQVGETVCSLQFATRVRAVELGASKKVVESAEVATLKKRIAELEAV